MKIKRTAKILLIAFVLLAFLNEPLAQGDKRVQQQPRAAQMKRLVPAFRGRNKSGQDLPRAENFQISTDQLGVILKGRR